MESRKYSEAEYRMISEIQHFCFCRRQWALIHLEQQWADNYLTTAGSIMHEKVHTKNLQDNRRGIITIRGMRVSSANLGISGECDAVEFVPSEKDGISLRGKKGLWQPYPVEYKRGKQKLDDCDRLQLAAQAICLEEMFSYPVEKGSIFYGAVRRRETVEINEALRNRVREMLNEMHKYAKAGYTPKVRISERCKACSLYDLCIPELMSRRESSSEYIRKHIKEVYNEEDA